MLTQARQGLWFVMEGEASLHACVLSGLADDVLSVSFFRNDFLTLGNSLICSLGPVKEQHSYRRCGWWTSRYHLTVPRPARTDKILEFLSSTVSPADSSCDSCSIYSLFCNWLTMKKKKKQIMIRWRGRLIVKRRHWIWRCFKRWCLTLTVW